MPALAVYAVLVATPVLVLLAAGRALELWCGSYPPRSTRRPGGAPVERLVGDLRRLEQDYRRIAASDMPARVARMRTVALAYDDTLHSCCRALGLPEPLRPLTALGRLQTEAALSQQGLVW